MTGPEHYQDAERWLRKAEAADDAPTTQSLAAIAQAHAMLAVAAAIDVAAVTTSFCDPPQ